MKPAAKMNLHDWGAPPTYATQPQYAAPPESDSVLSTVAVQVLRLVGLAVLGSYF